MRNKVQHGNQRAVKQMHGPNRLKSEKIVFVVNYNLLVISKLNHRAAATVVQYHQSTAPVTDVGKTTRKDRMSN